MRDGTSCYIDVATGRGVCLGNGWLGKWGWVESGEGGNWGRGNACGESGEWGMDDSDEAEQSREAGVARRGGGLGLAGEDMVVGGSAVGFR